MSYKKSFSEVESKYWGDYKARMSKAQGVEDVKKIFSMFVADMVKEIEPKLNPVYGEFEGDFEIDTEGEKKYKVSKKIEEDPIYKELVETSDLDAILDKFAEMAVNKEIHLSKKEPQENGKKIIH
ncbi:MULTISPECIES: hypothetical protein [Cetobacterium]|jgi:hypothetical protein|uniref:Uncharacterized protein n=1 Tax=Candidatus Cetobacterium colombiensis TaxID=3073100 RepID=A0ABU4W9U4_9FUSO|nr:hypothetical protein [Candidatus Cetobacterium colombiensis]MDX8335185.1 hypothetical protein [Candidatus Cetobacterium colombiensis]